MRTFSFVLCLFCQCKTALTISDFFSFLEMPSVYMLRFLLYIFVPSVRQYRYKLSSAWHFSVVNWLNCIICEMCRSFSFCFLFFFTKVPSWSRLSLFFPLKLISGLNFAWRERREQSLGTKVIQHWQLIQSEDYLSIFILDKALSFKQNILEDACYKNPGIKYGK